jgi:hypothetical protein
MLPERKDEVSLMMQLVDGTYVPPNFTKYETMVLNTSGKDLDIYRAQMKNLMVLKLPPAVLEEFVMDANRALVRQPAISIDELIRDRVNGYSISVDFRDMEAILGAMYDKSGKPVGGMDTCDNPLNGCKGSVTLNYGCEQRSGYRITYALGNFFDIQGQDKAHLNIRFFILYRGENPMNVLAVSMKETERDESGKAGKFKIKYHVNGLMIHGGDYELDEEILDDVKHVRIQMVPKRLRDYMEMIELKKAPSPKQIIDFVKGDDAAFNVQELPASSKPKANPLAGLNLGLIEGINPSQN